MSCSWLALLESSSCRLWTSLFVRSGRDKEDEIKTEVMKQKKWNDVALHKAGCPYRGIAVYGNENELVKYYSGYCPGCSMTVKWIMEPPAREEEVSQVQNLSENEQCAIRESRKEIIENRRRHDEVD
jgi:hypothetical protein